MSTATSPPLAVRELELSGGHTLDIEPTDTGSLLRITAVDQRMTLSILMTAQGPVIQLGGSGATLKVDGPMAIEADDLSLRGRKGVHLSSGGDLTVEAAGTVRSVGHTQEIVADLGPVKVKANDDVKLTGERILCNC